MKIDNLQIVKSNKSSKFNKYLIFASNSKKLMTVATHDDFRFKQFAIAQDRCTMKVNTDGVLLGAWSDVSGKYRTLDIGTGTGLIALMLAQRHAGMLVDAIDIDQDSAEQAQYNFIASPFAQRLTVYPLALQEFSISDANKYDLIVSNPPFFTGGTFSTNENKANVRHTVKLSHADLLGAVKQLLHPTQGHFDVVLPYIEGLRFIELATNYNFHTVKVVEVQSRPDKKIERLLIRLSLNRNETRVDTNMVIHAQDAGNDYSHDFIDMTRDFYLFM